MSSNERVNDVLFMFGEFQLRGTGKDQPVCTHIGCRTYVSFRPIDKELVICMECSKISSDEKLIAAFDLLDAYNMHELFVKLKRRANSGKRKKKSKEEK